MLKHFNQIKVLLCFANLMIKKNGILDFFSFKTYKIINFFLFFNV